ncbi:Anthranilate synthase, aminase component [hydrothermal vent metagenome]|uniref:Anthranilate synthase component 1 n=1 Tax=hydrothermal vent metagenome TaxID=652676 RepID=A0A3B1A3X9_9ZZZZ
MMEHQQITESIFTDLVQQGFNRIPLVRQVLADLDTPLSTYLKLANGPYSYLFESVQGGEKFGRYSIIGLPCRQQIRIFGKKISIYEDSNCIATIEQDDPLQWIEDFHKKFKVAELPDLPRFTGGLVGYFGYDTIRYIEPRLGDCPNDDPLNVPDILLMVSDEVLVFDNLAGKLFLIHYANPENKNAYKKGCARLEELIAQLQNSVPRVPLAKPSIVKESDFKSGFTEEKFKQAVLKAKEYIVEGDVMQVVLSQRMSIPYSAPPLDLYRSLRSLNPSPYMYYLDLGDFHIVGSSPEILVQVEDDMVTVRPIAGTRPRGQTTEQDMQLEKDLLADPKEIAEHLMLIDLGRNDIGRIVQTGTVEVTDKMVIERYSHVMHIVSNVAGKIKPNMSAMDTLRATFPAGTLSGAPKIRAMEIIDELEPVKRGVYGGAVGYLSWNGNMDTAIAIRTAVIKDNVLHIQAGAGVVYDSVPQSEWDETMNKGRAVFKAVEQAAAGLDGSLKQGGAHK